MGDGSPPQGRRLLCTTQEFEEAVLEMEIDSIEDTGDSVTIFHGRLKGVPVVVTFDFHTCLGSLERAEGKPTCQ